MMLAGTLRSIGKAVTSDDGEVFKVFTSFTLFQIKDLSVYRSFTNCLHFV